MTNPKITLDQWSALVAVVEAGGYAQASARLHRTQSTVTYTIKKLEDLLAVKGIRAAGPQGRPDAHRPGALPPRKSLLEEAGGWSAPPPSWREAGTRGPPGGGHRFPHLAAARVLRRLLAGAPDTRIELIESVLGGTDEALRRRPRRSRHRATSPADFLATR